MFKLILASKSKVRKDILDKTIYSSKVEPSMLMKVLSKRVY